MRRSYSVFLRTTSPPSIKSGDYRIQTSGGNIKFGVPFTEYDRVFFGVGVERTEGLVYQNIAGDRGKENSPYRYRQYVADYNNDFKVNDDEETGRASCRERVCQYV